MPCIEQALRSAVLILKQSPSARIDAEILLCHALNKPRSYLYTWSNESLSHEQYLAFQSYLNQRQKGVPVAHIVGYRDFWTLRLKVSPATLIPRPDTELLVELALEKLPKEPCEVLDLGTGTGAIALSLASERKDISVLGVDLSHEAVSLACENQKTLSINNANFIQSNWFDALQKQCFSLIVSNPPYIDEKDPHIKKGDVRFEPSSALTSKQNGLADIKHICQHSVKYLKIAGWLLIEHGFEQGNAVRNIFYSTGYSDIITKRDLNNLERVTMGRLLKN